MSLVDHIGKAFLKGSHSTCDKAYPAYLSPEASEGILHLLGLALDLIHAVFHLPKLLGFVYELLSAWLEVAELLIQARGSLLQLSKSGAVQVVQNIAPVLGLLTDGRHRLVAGVQLLLQLFGSLDIAELGSLQHLLTEAVCLVLQSLHSLIGLCAIERDHALCIYSCLCHYL